MITETKIVRLKQNQIELFKDLIILFNEVFEEAPKVASKEQLNKLLMNPAFYVLVAIKNGIVVGGLTAYQLDKYYNEKSELYIYDMAVNSELHNQGIGKMLINFLRDFSNKMEIETIFVEAHSEDIQAVKFYESTFGESEKVDHFNLELGTKKNDLEL